MRRSESKVLWWLASHRHAHTLGARNTRATLLVYRYYGSSCTRSRETREGRGRGRPVAAHAYTCERRRKDEAEPGLERNSSSRAVDTVLNLDLGHASPTTSQFDVLRKAERSVFPSFSHARVSCRDGVRVCVFIRRACHHHTLDIHTVRPGWKGRARSEVEVFP